MLARQRSHHFAGKYNQHKVFVPANARENHYLLAEIDTQALALEPLAQQQRVYQLMSQRLFQLCRAYQITNVCFLASEKRVKVRFAEEFQLIETRQQLLLFYHPSHNCGFRTLFDHGGTSRIRLVFLAHGERLREHAVVFHQQVSQLLEQFCSDNGLDRQAVSFEDRQHLTFDMFAAEKGQKHTQPHHFRYLSERYRQQALILPKYAEPLAYGIGRLTLTDGVIGNLGVDIDRAEDFESVYTRLYAAFCRHMKSSQIHQGYMLATDKNVVVNIGPTNSIERQAELLYLQVDVSDNVQQPHSSWPSIGLVNCIQCVFVARHGQGDKSHGKFVNQQLSLMRNFAREIGVNPNSEALTMRFYQSLRYSLDF